VISNGVDLRPILYRQARVPLERIATFARRNGLKGNEGGRRTMRRTLASLVLGMLLLLLLPASRSNAWSHGGHWHGGGWGWGWGGPRVVVGIGPGFGWAPGYWYYPPAYYYPPPVVVQQAPPVYIQRSAPPPAWYYCESANGYYPRVPTCPEPWVQVAPEPPE
jgi:hypothetical protein